VTPVCGVATVGSNYWAPAIQSRESAARDGLQSPAKSLVAPWLKNLFLPY
jgi:hypothetical protein